MPVRLYLDTSIWMDFFEDRYGFKGEPLGYYAWRMLALALLMGWRLVVTDILRWELGKRYDADEINSLFSPFANNIEQISSNLSQKNEARRICRERGIPFNDVLHAIMARDNNLILITRDRHFKRLRDITWSQRPEDVIENLARRDF